VTPYYLQHTSELDMQCTAVSTQRYLQHLLSLFAVYKKVHITESEYQTYD